MTMGSPPPPPRTLTPLSPRSPLCPRPRNPRKPWCSCSRGAFFFRAVFAFLLGLSFSSPPRRLHLRLNTTIFVLFFFRYDSYNSGMSFATAKCPAASPSWTWRGRKGRERRGRRDADWRRPTASMCPCTLWEGSSGRLARTVRTCPSATASSRASCRSLSGGTAGEREGAVYLGATEVAKKQGFSRIGPLLAGWIVSG